MGFLDRLLGAIGSSTAEVSTDDQSGDLDQSGGRHGMWTDHAGGYYVCSHGGCAKKVNRTISDHDCCGRCRPGRNCMIAAQANYAGPGLFAHAYTSTIKGRKLCDACGEAPEVH